MKKQMLILLSVLLFIGLTVTVNAQLLPPTNLTAQAGDGYVHLEWDEPAEEQTTEELIYDNDVYTGAYRWPGYTMGTQMSPAEDCQVLTLRFLTSGSGIFNAEVYNWADAQPGTTLLLDQEVTAIDDDWVDVDVSDDNLFIDGDFVVGFGSVNETAHIAYDGNLNNGRSWDYNPSDQSWTTWTEAYLIRAVVLYGDGTMEELSPVLHQKTTVPVVRSDERISIPVSGVNSGTVRDEELLGYNLYRDDNLVNPDPLLLNEYTDYDVENDVTYSYYVTAVYDVGESDPSNTVEATPQDTTPGLPAPINLTANLVGSDNVQLEWDEPEFGSWIHWDDGVNSDAIGTGEAAQFKVAARFSPDHLSDFGVVGNYLTIVSFVPYEANCNYSINVWVGGTPSQPGDMVVDQPVPAPEIQNWNAVELDNPVLITGDEELWIGYHVDTQTGFPAGCDAGPALDGMGNMMYFNNAWATLLDIAPTLDYNWNIQGFTSYAPGREVLPFAQTLRSDYVAHEQPLTFTSDELSLSNQSRRIPAPARTRNRLDLTGYRVYRNEQMIADVDDTAYLDEAIEPGLYHYYVTAVYDDDEESGPSNTVTVNTEVSTVLFDDFEDHPDFALQFAPWTTIDLDQSETYGFQDIDFPNEGSPMAYIIFNPSQTTPPMDLEAYSGEKMAASFAAVNPPNDDWLITPQISLGENSTLSFWARSYTTQWGMERMRVGVSNTSMLPATFSIISEEPYIEVPSTWTEYTFDLSEWDEQDVWVAINCVSHDAFILLIDDFHVQGVLEVDVDDNTLAPVTTRLQGNYPNPFNPETMIKFELQQPGVVNLEIFNIKGQKVATLVDGYMEAGSHRIAWDGKTDQNRDAVSGVYFYRMKSGSYSSTRKMILMK